MTDTEFAVTFKLMRGMRHLNTLERRIERFLGGNANGIVRDRATEPGYFIVRAFSRREPPPTCSALIGEYLYHERAAIDYMACELARRNNQIVDKHVEWPIFLTETPFEIPSLDNSRPPSGTELA